MSDHTQSTAAKTPQTLQPTIGLEIHVELKTATKMFCDCANDPHEAHANTNVCPVCLGHPGTLPTINKKAIESLIKVGLALGAQIAPYTKFDRKNYFYPDLPKGYQISQYDLPLVSGGAINGIRIRRIHMEEDVGRLQHIGQTSVIDYNRASVPLMELVTEPDVRSADEAVAFARQLQLILRYLGVSDADMEKGQMRIEPNVSLNMGTKVELKNINSFKAVHDGIEYEIQRHTKALETGEQLRQETRGWDEQKKATVHQRFKEDAHDYRYFPEPDLPPLVPAEIFDLELLKNTIPELPQAKRARLLEQYPLTADQADILVNDPASARYFEESASELSEKIPADPPLHVLANYLLSDIRGFISQRQMELSDLRIPPEHFAHLIALVHEKKITTRQAKDMIPLMHEKNADPEELIESGGFQAAGEDRIASVVDEVIAQNEKVAGDYKNGKTAALQFLIGKAIGALKGAADPQTLTELFRQRLK